MDDKKKYWAEIANGQGTIFYVGPAIIDMKALVAHFPIDVCPYKDEGSTREYPVSPSELKYEI